MDSQPLTHRRLRLKLLLHLGGHLPSLLVWMQRHLEQADSKLLEQAQESINTGEQTRGLWSLQSLPLSLS